MSGILTSNGEPSAAPPEASPNFFEFRDVCKAFDDRLVLDHVSFTVKREFNGNTTVTKYEGTVSGDEMKLKITRPGQDGTPMTSEVTAKRSAT